MSDDLGTGQLNPCLLHLVPGYLAALPAPEPEASRAKIVIPALALEQPPELMRVEHTAIETAGDAAGDRDLPMHRRGFPDVVGDFQPVLVVGHRSWIRQTRGRRLD